ncbi:MULTISPECIES: iron ABC transporter permease [unclassified Nocardia]|uniref:FecCD family ABC transporter permease n=1 Tax=unclassified Nocardia TaxID=2637762 RepID=UPI001CE3C62D|nr:MULTISPECIES: iron ABC transporter permease [unclassified Nocardia]
MSRAGRPPLARMPLPVAIAGSAVLLLAVAAVAVCVGSATVSLADTGRVLIAHLSGRTPDLGFTVDQIVWNYRLPRVVLAALCGAGLSVSGVILQALVNNSLADPYVLGASSGASLGAVLVIVAAGGGLGGIGVSMGAFLGAMAAVAVVFLLGQQRGTLVPARLVLAGVAIGYLLLAATNYLQLRATPNELRSVMFWTMGSVAGASWQRLGPVTAVVLFTLAVVLAFGRRLNVLVTGDDQATALGVDVRALRITLLVLTSLLTGALIAVAGGIGFVGLMIPHLVRLVFGSDHRRVLPLCTLLGAAYLIAVDLLSRIADPPNELPIGIFTAAFGAPFFLWLLRRNGSPA